MSGKTKSFLKMNKKPNIILITIDCLRADHCGWLNPENKHLTPFLNSLAEKSAIFTNVYATGPYTKLAFPGILTGTYPLDFIKFNPKTFPDITKRPYLPKILQDNGYFTIAVHDNPFLSAFFGYDRGFNIFKDLGMANYESKVTETFYLNKKFNFQDIKNIIFKKLGKNNYYQKIKKFIISRLPWIKKLFIFMTSPIITPRTKIFPFDNPAKNINKAILAETNFFQEPLFIWAHYMDLHEPYILPPLQENIISSILSDKDLEILKNSPEKTFWPYRGLLKNNYDLLKKFYQLNLIYLDQQLKILFDYLKILSKNSIIIITADHGEEFMEHGNWGHIITPKNNKLFKELLNVPLLIKIPNKKAEKIQTTFSASQLPATILESVNILPEKNMEPGFFSKKSARIFAESMVNIFSFFGGAIRKISLQKIDIKNL